MEPEATIRNRESCRLSGSKMSDVPSNFPVNGGTDLWSAEVENVLSSRKTDSSRKEDQNGNLYPPACQEGDSVSFSTGSPPKSYVSEGKTKDSDPEDLMERGEAETFMLSTLPIQEFSSLCVLDLFLDSLDIQENKSTARREIPSRKSVSGNYVASSAESGSNEDVQDRNRSYSDATIENAMVDRNSSAIQIQFACNDQDFENNECKVIETRFTRHKHVNSVTESVTTLMPHDEGESSFSASGLIAFSGSIAYSGSLSLGSDGSATSARSFAFPMLQSEWNSSPVRMAKADKRHFRKHRRWTSSLLCCRF